MFIKGLLEDLKKPRFKPRPIDKTRRTRHPGSKKPKNTKKNRAAAKRARASRKRNR